MKFRLYPNRQGKAEKTMFTITENNILKDFSCRYEDEYHNKIRLARKGQGFYAKLKFGNDKVTLPVIHVNFPVQTEDKGLRVVLNFSDGIDHSGDKDVSAAVEGTTTLINRWIMMLTDVMAFDLNRAQCGEAAAKKMMKDLRKYEELRPAIEAVM